MARSARGGIRTPLVAAALAGWLAATVLVPAPARAAEVTLPLTVPFSLLSGQLERDMYTDPGGVTQLWRETSCRYLTLDHPAFDRRDAFLRFVTHGQGVAGTRLLGFCLNALRWRGYVEAMTTPYVTPEWQLRLRVAESSLYDDSSRKGVLSGLLWDATQRLLLPRLTALSVDLTPPRDDMIGLVRMMVAPADVQRMNAILKSAAVRRLEVRDDAVVVHLVLDMPQEFVQARPAPAQSEPPLTPAELEVAERALERWDAFLVFVVKRLGLDITDPGIRADLFGLLIGSRYQLLPVLTGPVRRSEGDPVRRLFTEAWGHLHEILARADQRGLLGDRARFASFIAAGDALAALDRAAPGLGIEISADGLRRMARLLAPGSTEDPLLYGVDVDAALRALFGLPPESELAPAPAPPPGPAPSPAGPASPSTPGRGSGLLVRPVVYTGPGAIALADEKEPAGDELSALNDRLARWVPEDRELADYRPVVSRLLGLTGDRALKGDELEARYTRPYRTLLPATALQEKLLAPVRAQGRLDHLPGLGARQRGAHADQSAGVARLLQRRAPAVGHRLQRPRRRRDSPALPAAVRHRGGPAQRWHRGCGARDLRGLTPGRRR